MARTGLGRGLDVLLGQTSPTIQLTAATEIPLERISPNRQQPRTSFPAESIAELAESIKRHGVLQPVVVSRRDDGYELVAGQRRVLASRVAGKTSIPAVIREDVSDRLELALVENLQRADLNAIESARAYKLLMETYDLTQEQLAERLGKSRSAIANTMRALQAPQVLQDAVSEGKISEGHLRALASLPLSVALNALADVLAKGMSVRQAEALARKMVRPTGHQIDRRQARSTDPEMRQAAADLRTALGTKVDITRGRRGGRIAIEFYSSEDFERLYELLLRAGKSG